MDELITISQAEGPFFVSARELYTKLGFNLAAWARWFKKNIVKNQFATENEDWIPLNLKSNEENQQLNPNPTIDCRLTIEFSKKLCMLAKTEMGNVIRNYLPPEVFKMYHPQKLKFHNSHLNEKLNSV